MTQEEEFVKLVDNFKNVLAKVKLNKGGEKINFFTITKMLSLETKHSAFLAWLLDSGNEHAFGNLIIIHVLKELCKFNGNTLYNYGGLIVPNTLASNDASNLPGIDTTNYYKMAEKDLLVIAGSTPVDVETETRTKTGKRMDILIKIPNENTLIVIENKIDSTVHDDQLKEYQKEIYTNSRYYPFVNKFFIYLTKNGEKPYNKDGSINNIWFRLSYNEIVKVIEWVIMELKNKSSILNIGRSSNERNSLIKILEDYKAMVDKNILNNNPTALKTCYELLNNKDIKIVYDILKEYETFPSNENVRDFVVEHLNNCFVPKNCKSKVICTVRGIEDFFVKHKGEYDRYKVCYLCCQANGAEDDIKIWINYQPKESSDKINLFLKINGVALPPIDGTLKINGKDSIILVSKNERGKKLEDLKGVIKQRLDIFDQDILMPFLDILSKL